MRKLLPSGYLKFREDPSSYVLSCNKQDQSNLLCKQPMISIGVTSRIKFEDNQKVNLSSHIFNFISEVYFVESFVHGATRYKLPLFDEHSPFLEQ